MQRGILFAFVLFILSGCSFSKSDIRTLGSEAEKQRVSPGEIKIKEADTKYVLIDVIDLPQTDYDIDLVRQVDGTVEYPIVTPEFTDTQCEGLGYSVQYKEGRRQISSQLVLKAFVDGQLRESGHVVAKGAEKVQIAVYAPQVPLAEYYETGALPNETVKSIQPSNRCHRLCAQARVKPVRPLTRKPGEYDCTYWIMGWDGRMPTSQETPDMHFMPAFIERLPPENRERYFSILEKCGAVKSNEDLENYYKQASESCNTSPTPTTPDQILREWYFVEIKVQFSRPVYRIKNFAQVVKSTTETQLKDFKEQLVHPASEWTHEQ